MNWSEWKNTNMSEFEKYFYNFYSNCIVQIRIKMTEKNITQKELAEISGIKQPAISRMMTMDAIPRLDTLMKILFALEIEFELKNKN
ncbi:helix-turn-helix transcriptional regulator [Bacillus sp. AG4(2022)]|uniref:helix-turn-helix domain-containing protein n=1 Tax=Bacillus sp. AG4(2022) TaxID=2962594 RepID=UPI00288120D9|nr:helix-turn-helix transcriptional regulator [Bacillus sp. AG4(2022)]MDT0160333.1 helix-turn-helix transcriptional regulator [Bacillus sp. AG4(2022)]